MADLAALGVNVQRQYVTVDDAEVTEGLADKLLKIFKKEIQIGDPLFDQHVHIKTDTTDATEALLQSTDLRAVIERVITDGGAIEIDGNTVKMEIPGRHEKEDDVLVLFVQTLLG